MRVGILGPLRVATGGGDVEVGGARVRALLIRLSLDAGRVVSVDALAAALWPQAIPAQPTNAVQTLVSRLRRVLGPGTVVWSDGGYRLDVPSAAVDAIRFEQLARQGRQALRDGDPAVASHRLREALALWRGEALTDVADTPYAAAAAARLAELRLAATEDRIAAELAHQPPAPLVAELRELVATHPLRERLRALLVRALHADGRPAEALAAYEQSRRLLADELGADPGPELRRAHLAVLRGTPAPERTAASHQPPATGRSRGNLRAELTSFVGRGQEQQRLRQRLGESRLVTLVGPGGAGKTRLATAVAAAAGGHLPGGTWLVELAPVTDPAELPAAVVGALGLREVALPEAPGPPPDPVGRLVEALSGTAALLVLDNCEHLLDTVAPMLHELLGRCPPLRVLATSREPLGILGEALFPVPPLALPEPGTPAEEAAGYPALRLFADRAAAARPGFAVTDDNVAEVTEICRRLDGLPLAIELAAARLRSLTLGQLAAGLDDRFRLLTGGGRTAETRHRTLQAVVAWSWELLEPGERRAAQRLSVFPGAITPAAAARVCDLGPAARDTLAALVDKSLLHLSDDAELRYRMLETIREYGRQRLAEAGELTGARAAHAAYHLDLAEQAAPHLRGAGQLPWLASLRADDGGGAAFGFAHDTGDTDTLVRLAAALSYFWTIQGDHAAAARRLRTALAAPGDAPPVARAEVAAAYLFNAMLAGGDSGEAVRAVRDDRGWAVAHPAAARAEAALALADHDTAAGLRATARYRCDPDPWIRGMSWLLQSWLHGNEGAVEQLRRDLDAAVAAFRQAGERWGLAVSLTHRAHGQTSLGDLDGAVAGLTEALVQQQALGETDDGAVLQRVLLAAVRAQQGDRQQARAELQRLVEPGAGTPTARTLVLARLALGDLDRLDGDLAAAARQYDAAGEQLARAPFDASLFRAMLLCARGHLAVAEGRPEPAGWYLAEALSRAVEAPDLPIAAEVAVAVARLRRYQGAGGTAAEVLGAAHALRGSSDHHDPDVADLTGRLLAELGEPAFRAAYHRGRELDRDGALTLNRAQLPQR